MPRATHDGAPTEPPRSAEEPRLEHETLAAPRSLGHKTEAELLGLMCNQQAEQETARDAWDELYNRHMRYLHLLVAKTYGRQLDDCEIADVVVDAVQAAFHWAGRQGSPENVVAQFNNTDPDQVRRRVLGWLSVIARRNALHCIADRQEPYVHLRDEDVPGTEASEPPSTALSGLLAGALKKLADEEVEALRVSLPWYQPETGQFALPRGEAAKIAASLGITVDALRQRRHRSLKRLESVLGAK